MLDLIGRGHLLVLFAAAVTMLSRLWEGDLRRDEVLYAAVAKGIGTHGDWLNLHLGTDPYWKKPPLMFWLAAGAYRVLGLSSFSARLVPALFGVLSCLLLYVLARRLLSERLALLAALVLAATPRFLRTAATFNLDTAVTLATVSALACATRCGDAPRYRDLSVAGAAWGLGVMAKGAFGLLAPAVVLVYLAVHRRLRFVASGPFLAFIVTGVAVALPWHVYEMVTWGSSFLDTYLRQEVVDRVAGRLWLGYEPDSYVVELLRDDWPWLGFTAIGIACAMARVRRGDRGALFVLAWALGYLLLLHASAGRRGQYLVHFYPPGALLAAFAIERLLPARWLSRTPRAAGVLFAAAAFVLLVLPVPVHGWKADEMKALGPALQVLAPDPARPLLGFRVNAHVRASSLVYLERDVHDRPLASIPRSAEALVLTERVFAPQLEAAGFVPAYANARYVLFRSP